MTGTNMPDVEAASRALEASVIVCTRNRPHLLGRLLEALSTQTMPDDRREIIIVDDGSAEATQTACREWQERVPGFRVVRHTTRRGLAAGRNTGVAAAAADRLLFTDDDCIPAPEWIESMAEALGDHAIVAGAVDTPPSPFWMYCHNLAQFYGSLPTGASGPTDCLAGANFGIQRETLARLKGFRQPYDFAEDTEFILRARRGGHQAWFHPDGRVLHVPERATLRDLLRYSAAHAVSTSRLRLDYADVLATPLVLKHPLLLALASPLCAGWITWRTARAAPLGARAFAAMPFIFIAKLWWCAGAINGIRRYRRANAP